MGLASFAAFGLFFLLAAYGHQLGPRFNPENGRALLWIFAAMGAGTALVSLVEIVVTGIFRRDGTPWVAALLWALAAGFFGTVVTYIILMLAVRWFL